jgi:hypothetical protein
MNHSFSVFGRMLAHRHDSGYNNCQGRPYNQSYAPKTSLSDFLGQIFMPFRIWRG